MNIRKLIIKNPEIRESWKKILINNKNKFAVKTSEAFSDLNKKINDTDKYYPPQDKIFNSFHFFEMEKTKVVIIGQDPYKSEGQANGLSFSVNDGVKHPKSLKNIIDEINNDGYQRTNGNFTDLAKQGVLFLNSILTLSKGKSMSHGKINKKNYPEAGGAWEYITAKVVYNIAKKNKKVVFLLWGNYAKDLFQNYILKGNKTAHILTCSHPSPLSYKKTKVPFHKFGSFKKTNEILKKQGLSEINWNDA